MKFASVLACLGAVAAQAAPMKSKQEIVASLGLANMTCLELHNVKDNLRSEVQKMYSIPWSQDPCNQQSPSVYNQTACAVKNIPYEKQSAYYEWFYNYGAFDASISPHHKCENEESPVRVMTPTSRNGIASANVNWKKVANSSMEWAKYFKAESRSAEAQEIAGHLNIAAQKMVSDIAADQISVAQNGGKLVKHFIEWVEPGSHECNSTEFLECLHGQNPFQSRPSNIFSGSCGQSSNCTLFSSKNAKYNKHRAHDDKHHTERALKTMAQDVSKSFMTEIRDQEGNAMTVMQNFLTEARERFTAWGCDAECTKKYTRRISDVKDIFNCGCPAVITISGDTSALDIPIYH